MRKDYNVLICCVASHSFGFGHLSRCCSLAEELVEYCNVKFFFYKPCSPNAVVILQNKELQLSFIPSNESDDEVETKLISEIKNKSIDILIFDMPFDLPTTCIRNIRKFDIILATLDDATNKRKACDLAFYPPSIDNETLDWDNSACRVIIGSEYIILHKQFQKFICKNNLVENKIENRILLRSQYNILITMGASDPLNYTLLTIEALKAADLDVNSLFLTIVLGPEYKWQKQLKESLQNFKYKHRVLSTTDNMAELMYNSNLAIASFGHTAYELFALEIPSIILSISDQHYESAKIVQKKIHHEFTLISPLSGSCELTISLNNLIKNLKMRRLKKNKKRKHIDGLGARRISKLLFDTRKINNQ